MRKQVLGSFGVSVTYRDAVVYAEFDVFDLGGGGSRTCPPDPADMGIARAVVNGKPVPEHKLGDFGDKLMNRWAYQACADAYERWEDDYQQARYDA